jgi:hypothetical protein
MRGRKIGAPPKRDPEPGERFQIGVRVTPELKRRLDAAAEQSGRSQSQEAELRLERSFDRTDLLPQVLTLAYGDEIAADLMRLGARMKARSHRKETPIELGRAVMHAAREICKIAREYEDPRTFMLPRREIATALIASLYDFLAPDWRKAGQEWRDKDNIDAEAAEGKAKEKVRGELVDFFMERRKRAERA